MNPLFAYVLSGILARILGTIRWETAAGTTVSLKGWIYQSLYASWLPPKLASLSFALSIVAIILAFCWVLFKRKIYIKV